MDLNYVFAAVIAAFMIAGMIYDAGYRRGYKHGRIEMARKMMNGKYGFYGMGAEHKKER